MIPQPETETLIQRWRRIAPNRLSLADQAIRTPTCFKRPPVSMTPVNDMPLRAPLLQAVALVAFIVGVVVSYSFAVWGF